MKVDHGESILCSTERGQLNKQNCWFLHFSFKIKNTSISVTVDLMLMPPTVPIQVTRL